MRPASHVPSNENVICDHSIGIKSTTGSITGYPMGVKRQPRIM
nr:hypothetical protein [Methanosarcina barkeri]